MAYKVFYKFVKYYLCYLQILVDNSIDKIKYCMSILNDFIEYFYINKF